MAFEVTDLLVAKFDTTVARAVTQAATQMVTQAATQRVTQVATQAATQTVTHVSAQTANEVLIQVANQAAMKWQPKWQLIADLSSNPTTHTTNQPSSLGLAYPSASSEYQSHFIRQI